MIKQFEYRLTVAVIGAILAVAVVFRFLWLETIPGLNGDEAWLGWKAARAANGVPLDWRTNSGNFTNPFFLLPLVLVHHLFEPSAWVVRCVAAVSGLLALLANFFMCRRVFDIRVAWASTLLLAVMPMAIAYSRFGWEPSQIPLFSVFIIYSAIALADPRRTVIPWIMVAGVSVFCGFLVHPTMAYLGLFPVFGFVSRWVRPEESPWRFTALIMIGGLSALLLGVAMYLKAPAWIQPEITGRFEGWAWLRDMPGFLVAWLRNFNGINIFEYLPGSWPGAEKILNLESEWPVFKLDIAVWLAFLMAMVLMIQGVKYARFNGKFDHGLARKVLVLLAGFLLATLLFGVMNGTAKVAVWFDRYGLWALVPGCLILALGFTMAVRLVPNLAFVFEVAGLLSCAVLLGLYWYFYFAFFLETGGEAPWRGTRVAERQEAKSASEALKNWRTSIKESGKPVLMSADWFAYWPLAYYMQRGNAADGWEMVYAGAEALEQLRGVNSFRERFGKRDVVVVEFDGVDTWGKWKEVFPERYWDGNALVLRDIAGRPNLRLDFPVSVGKGRAMP